MWPEKENEKNYAIFQKFTLYVMMYAKQHWNPNIRKKISAVYVTIVNYIFVRPRNERTNS